MRQKKLVQQIREAVSSGKVKEPFKPSDFGFLEKSQAFLSKHCVGNPNNYTEYFKRTSRGLYELIEK